MIVYNVGGIVTVLALSEGAAMNLLREKAESADMDLMDERVEPNTPGNEEPGFYATGMLCGLFEAGSVREAKERFIRRIISRTGLQPLRVDAFECGDAPREWAR